MNNPNATREINLRPIAIILGVALVLFACGLGLFLGGKALLSNSTLANALFDRPNIDVPTEPFAADPAQVVENLARQNVEQSAQLEEQATVIEAQAAEIEEIKQNDDNYPVIEEMAELPLNWDAWLNEQVFDQTINGCDPKSYTANNWWLESTAEDGSKFDGNQGAEYDIVLREVQLANFGAQNESVIVWASSVQVYVYGTDELLYEGNGPVKVEGPGRFLVKIQNGGYRIGVDLGGEFVPYWTEVLSCLYGDNWNPAVVK